MSIQIEVAGEHRRTILASESVAVGYLRPGNQRIFPFPSTSAPDERPVVLTGMAICELLCTGEANMSILPPGAPAHNILGRNERAYVGVSLDSRTLQPLADSTLPNLGDTASFCHVTAAALCALLNGGQEEDLPPRS